MASGDALLRGLVRKHFGYRIVGQPDLFESLVWAVLGQQINVQFAYTLKQRFVERYGSRLDYDGETFYLFPTPAEVSLITETELQGLQFSRQKSRYTLALADAFMSGQLSQGQLSLLSLAEARAKLVAIKGIGNWTANYALMKTFRFRDAFPREDVGIHNAIRLLKKMDRKPTLVEVEAIFRRYAGWEAYATLYLWKAL
jgi:DNA-3-methyladenine glycosylase II